MKTHSDMVKYEKLKGCEPLSFSNHIRRKKKSSMAEYILRHGISVAKDFTPETFGRLTTIGPCFLTPIGTKGRRIATQVCVCSCGKSEPFPVLRQSLLSKNTNSCGCFQSEQTSRAKTTHGLSTSAIYRVWNNARERCYNPKNKAYHDYGGRGIVICDRWLEPNGQGFVNFVTDMGEMPSPKHEIDRKEVNGNYEPDNCRWVTLSEQARNKRNSRNLTYQGKTQNVNDWAEEVGIKAHTILSRLRIGWTIEKALTTPPRTLERNRNAAWQ